MYFLYMMVLSSLLQPPIHGHLSDSVLDFNYKPSVGSRSNIQLPTQKEETQGHSAGPHWEVTGALISETSFSPKVQMNVISSLCAWELVGGEEVIIVSHL